MTDEVLQLLKRRKQLGAVKKVPVWGQFESMNTYDKMVATLEPAASGGSWDLLVYGCGVDMPASNDPDDIVAWSDQLVKTYLLIFQVLQRKPSLCPKVCVLTSDTHSNDTATHKEAGVCIAAAGPLFGMSNTMRVEVPTTAIHYVDLEFTVTDEIIGLLASELTRRTGFGVNSVRLNSQGRFVARMTPAEPRYTSTSKFVTPSSGIIAIGGGNGALGLVMGKYFLEHLADPHTATVHIKFLSRSCRISGDGNEQLWKTVRALADAAPGVIVEQAKCDVSSREAIETFVKQHADSLVGFVHSAGILRDGVLANQTFDKYDDVYKPKAWAGLYLHHALEEAGCPKLEFCWMFSSVAVYGNLGQTNYSGANSLLDVVCRHRVALGKPATAMQWAGWGEVGMAASMDNLAKKRMAESPIPFFTNAQGLRGMEIGLSTGIPTFCVMRYNAEAFFEKLDKNANKEQLTASERYEERFWSVPIPPQRFSELELYDCLTQAYSSLPPKELTYDYFVAGIDPLPKETALVPVFEDSFAT